MHYRLARAQCGRTLQLGRNLSNLVNQATHEPPLSYDDRTATWKVRKDCSKFSGVGMICIAFRLDKNRELIQLFLHVIYTC